MKIFTNTQTSSVAGISRVIHSFASYVRSSQIDENIELVTVSIDPRSSEGTTTWRKEVRGGKYFGKSLFYQRELPLFGDVIRNSRYLDDVRDAYKPLTEALRNKIKQEKPDIVLANGTYFMPWCLVMAARSLNVPVVVYYHGSLTKETEHWEGKHAKRLLHFMEGSFDRADIRYLFPSNLIKNYIEKTVFRRPLLKRNVAVISNPIPEEFFRVRRRKAKKSIGFVGRWTRIKNTAFLVRLIELNRKAKEPFDIYVLTDSASRLHAAKILHDYVHFVRPRNDSASLAKFYARMSAIICPSHFETYGNVAQEAVAAGTPAFVSKNMGVAEVFEKVGLEKLVLDFSKPKDVFNTLRKMDTIKIDRTARRALRKAAGAQVVHKKLLEYLRS